MNSIDPDETERLIAICDRLIDLYLFQEAVTDSSFGEAGYGLQTAIDELLTEAVSVCPRQQRLI